MHLIELALSLAFDKAGSSIAARIAIMAITTSNSINVKAKLRAPRPVKRFLIESILALVESLRYRSIGLCGDASGGYVGWNPSSFK